MGCIVSYSLGNPAAPLMVLTISKRTASAIRGNHPYFGVSRQHHLSGLMTSAKPISTDLVLPELQGRKVPSAGIHVAEVPRCSFNSAYGARRDSITSPERNYSKALALILVLTASRALKAGRASHSSAGLQSYDALLHRTADSLRKCLVKTDDKVRAVRRA